MSNLNLHIDPCARHRTESGAVLPTLRRQGDKSEIKCIHCGYTVFGRDMGEARWIWNNAHALQRVADKQAGMTR